MAAKPLFTVEEIQGVYILKLADAIYCSDPLLENDLMQQLQAFAEQHQPRKLILDFEKLSTEALFSNVIGILFQFRRKLNAWGGRAAICNVKSSVRENIEISDPKEFMFKRCGTVADAWEWLQSLEK
jgi:anti-anti-sigma regulatory factor